LKKKSFFLKTNKREKKYSNEKKTYLKKNVVFLLFSNFKPTSKQKIKINKQKKQFTSRNRKRKKEKEKGNKGGKKNLFQILQQLARGAGKG
jgi:hypothetical protein